VLGQMEPSFLDLPPEVIKLSMRTHQKYFAVKRPGADGLAPNFILVANIAANDGGAKIAEGNARVLSARLSDARFFWEKDKSTPLDVMCEKLKTIAFKEELGSLGDKVERVAALARELAPKVGADADLAERAARLEAEDTGKPLALAKSLDIPRAAANLRFFATAILHEAGESFATERPARAINYTVRKPLGVVGCISPWNLPLYLFTWKIAPALAAGNAVIAKPSELTPTTCTSLSMARRAPSSGVWNSGPTSTSKPRSAKAEATTLAPRSWPSWPSFTTSMRGRRPSR